jgi:MoxR-vWA-beta-propeller ternary system protein
VPDPLAIDWTTRDVPLPPVAVAARGPVAAQLIERLRGLPEDRLARLEGGATESLVVVMGASVDLPWVDGVTYLGREPDAGELLVPTTRVGTAPAALIEAALRRRAGLDPGPFAVLLDPLTVVPLASLRRIERAALGT